jgi:hypothetical protein
MLQAHLCHWRRSGRSSALRDSNGATVAFCIRACNARAIGRAWLFELELFESAKLLQPHRVLAGFALLLCSMLHHVSAARSEQRAVLFSRTRSKRVPQARARRRIPKQPAHPLAGHSRFSRFTQRRLLLRERAHCPQMHARRRNC